MNRESEWSLKDNDVITDEFFEINHDMFEFFGGSIELYIHSIKNATCKKRVLMLPPDERFILTKEDINVGFEAYVKNNENKKERRRIVIFFNVIHLI